MINVDNLNRDQSLKSNKSLNSFCNTNTCNNVEISNNSVKLKMKDKSFFILSEIIHKPRYLNIDNFNF
jgi:hypothetical protein